MKLLTNVKKIIRISLALSASIFLAVHACKPQATPATISVENALYQSADLS